MKALACQRPESYRRYLLVPAAAADWPVLAGKVDARRHGPGSLPGVIFRQFRGSTEKEFLGWLRQILASLLAGPATTMLQQQLGGELDQSSQALDRAFGQPQLAQSQQLSGANKLLLADAPGRLPEDCADLLILRHLEGLTFPEVAQRMGRTIDSVKKLCPGRLRL